MIIFFLVQQGLSKRIIKVTTFLVCQNKFISKVKCTGAIFYYVNFKIISFLEQHFNISFFII